MARTEIEEKFNYLVTKVIWPYFKSLGYKKSGNNFRFYNEEGWGKIVNFQKSISYSKQHIHFTLNIGLFLDDSYLYFGRSPGNKFTEYECVIKNRIGQLIGLGDTWYDLTSKTDTDGFNQEIRSIFNEYIIPYLSKYNSKKDIFSEIINKKQNNTIELECLFYNGYKKEALSALEKGIKETNDKIYLRDLLRLKKELENNQ